MSGGHAAPRPPANLLPLKHGHSVRLAGWNASRILRYIVAGVLTAGLVAGVALGWEGIQMNAQETQVKTETAQSDTQSEVTLPAIVWLPLSDALIEEVLVRGQENRRKFRLSLS